jgi:hypothetical protein
MSDEIDKLLSEWYELKDKISRATKREDYIKQKVKRVMQAKERNTLPGLNYTVKLSKGSNEYISKKTIPKDLWDKYKKVTRFDRMTISKKKNSK